ncbi:MAG: hypothetical protein K7J46_21870 [Bryobacter sp.]|nr:hypothetical protein [Bryobacter sp. CoA8 C33]
MVNLAVVLALFAQSTATFEGSMVYDVANGPVKYEQPPDNEISKLRARLSHEPRHGYLLSLLRALNIPLSSQTLVFSKTSFQAPLIFPSAPRAIFFNDDTYVGWVKGADYLEISTADAKLGAVFYVVEQEPRANPRLTRHDDCLQCHHSARTAGVPGHILRSVYTQPSGQIHTNTSSYFTDQRSPWAERWGGWYVSTPVSFTHLGNRLFPTLETSHPLRPFDSPSWPAPTSDIVAHLVLAHQATGHNYLARLNYETRSALQLQHVMNEMDHKPDVEASWSESTQRRIRNAIEAAVRYLTFADEEPLPRPIKGDSSFSRDFSSPHPLKKLNLKTRVFEYPLSYLMLSRVVQGLDSLIRAKLEARLEQVLLHEAGRGDFARLDAVRAREAWALYRHAHARN